MTQAADWKRELCELFFVRRTLILGAVLAGVLLAVALMCCWPPTYRASTAVLLRGKRIEIVPAALNVTGAGACAVSREDVASELEILRAPALLERTARRLLATPRPAGGGGWFTRLLGRDGSAAADSPRALARRMRDNLRASRAPNAKVIRLSYDAGSRTAAEQALDTLVAEYLLYRNEIYSPPDQQEFLSARSRDYRTQLEALEDELAGLLQTNAVCLPEQELSDNLDMKKTLLLKLGSLRDELAASPFVSNPVLVQRIAGVQEEIQALDQRNILLQRVTTQARRMSRETGLLSYSYEMFSKRGEESRLANDIGSASLSGDVAVLSRAAQSAERVFPRPLCLLLAGLTGGLLAGFLLALLDQYLDHTFRRPADVARHAGLPVIFSVKQS